MHALSVRTEFLRLRAQGLSLATIGRRLGVSKPTLIKWSRQSQPEIAAEVSANRQAAQAEITTSIAQELADVNRRLTAVKQELFSRAIREIPTATLEALAGQLNQRLDFLQSQSADPSSQSHRIAPIHAPKL